MGAFISMFFFFFPQYEVVKFRVAYQCDFDDDTFNASVVTSPADLFFVCMHFFSKR